MIHSIELENFKGIRDRVRLDLKPVTLLFGPNSAGKSTVISLVMAFNRPQKGRVLVDGHDLAEVPAAHAWMMHGLAETFDAPPLD